MVISIYFKYETQGLQDELMSLDSGNAEELHNAMIVMCNIIKRMEAKIVKLEKRVSELEADKPAPEHDEYRERRARWDAQV